MWADALFVRDTMRRCPESDKAEIPKLVSFREYIIGFSR